MTHECAMANCEALVMARGWCKKHWTRWARHGAPLEAVTHSANVRRGLAGELREAKTHCAHGHAFDGATTYWNYRGWRECRVCIAERNRRYYVARQAVSR